MIIEFAGQPRDFSTAYCWIIRPCGQGASAEVWFSPEDSAIEEFISLEAAHERRKEICKEILRRREPMINTMADRLDEIRGIKHAEPERDSVIDNQPVSFWRRSFDWWNRWMVATRPRPEEGSISPGRSDNEEL